MENWLNILSAFGPTIATLVVVYVSVKQKNISQKNHNLDLLNQRWKMLEELKVLGKRAMNFKHRYYQNVKSDSEENYWNMRNELNLFASKCLILFNADLENKFNETADLFGDYHSILDKLLDWEQYHEECPEKYTEEDRNELYNQKNNYYIEMNRKFSNFYKDMLEFIKKAKIDND